MRVFLSHHVLEFTLSICNIKCKVKRIKSEKGGQVQRDVIEDVLKGKTRVVIPYLERIKWDIQ